MMVAKQRRCAAEGCDKFLPRNATARRKYHSESCRNTQKSRERRRKRRGETVRKNRNTRSTGHIVEQLVNTGYGEQIRLGRLSLAHVAREWGYHSSALSRAYDGYIEVVKANIAAEGWEMDPTHAAFLAHDLDAKVQKALDDLDDERFEELLEMLVDRFVGFRGEFFRTKRGPFYTEAFHRGWIKAILRSIYTGSNQMILSPPRHGKSELLVHFCVWIICRDPNISILWQSVNLPVAKIMLKKVKAELEFNQHLITSMLPPGQYFKPLGRAGSDWAAEQFSSATQDPTLVKGPTMVAVGRSGATLSRDADLIVGDDIEDHESTRMRETRTQNRKRFYTQLESRAEEHTAFVLIGSRQHSDDLYGYLLFDAEWGPHAIVESAHSETCAKDPAEIGRHTDCMLFPKLRSYAWLRKKQLSARALSMEDHFEMVYLNRPRPEGSQIFTEADIKACFNKGRGIGTAGLPSDVRMVAGLDPSSTGYQAGFCWGWSAETGKLYLIDIENHQGGGIAHALGLFRRWHRDFKLYHWVVEENGFQKAIRLDRDVSEWADTNGVKLEGHETQGGNKWDPHFGVGAMSKLFRDRKIDLPVGTTEAREKSELFMRQCLNFTDNNEIAKRKRVVSDVLMASWFPQKVIRRWTKEFSAHMQVEYDPLFPGFDGVDYGAYDYQEAPW